METVRTAPLSEHIMRIQLHRQVLKSFVVDGIVYNWTRYYDKVLVWDGSEALIGSAQLEITDEWILVDAYGDYLGELDRDETTIGQVAYTIAALA